MFETWKRKRRIRNEFRGAYGTAFESPDLHERIRAAQHALQLVEHPDLDPWPFSRFVPRRRAIGKLHATMGRSYLQLRNENPRQLARLGMQETQLATQILNNSDGVEWAMALTDLSVAYADSIEGARADNLERAIEVGEAALKAIDRQRNLMEWMAVAGNLAQYYAERRCDSRDGNVEKAISLLESVLAEATKHATPFQRAPVLLDLGTMYARRRRFGKDENVERAIRCIEEGLASIPIEMDPPAWAMGQLNLSMAYAERPEGNKSENFRRAFRANDAALEVFERIGDRERWARAKMIRTTLFTECPYDDLESRTRKAVEACENALDVFTAEDYPAEHDEVMRTLQYLRAQRHSYSGAGTIEDVIREGEQMLATEMDSVDRATTLTQLGNAYAERAEGNRSQNMERSIELLEEAVTLFDQRAEPVKWGLVMNNLAQSYLERNEGLHADNIERVLALSEAALAVVPSRSDPSEHSALLETLAGGFVDRVRGDRRENLERAMQIYSNASSERNPEDNPESWLRLQQKWRQAYSASSLLPDHDKSTDKAADRAVETLEVHLAKLQSYATMVSATDYPRTWVAAQLDLGDAYTRAAPSSDPGDFDSFVKEVQSNCRKALAIYEEMSAFVEKMNDDVRWALVQDRIGNAHAMLYLFAKTPGLEAAPEERQRHYAAAIEAHSASLRVHTLERSPRKHLEMSVYLGRLHTYEGDWQAAEERFAAAARAADRLLADVELSESDMRAVLRELGRTAMLAPFVALMLGQPERALELAETGRARLLAKALSLEALPLSVELRRQLHELQRQVATHERRLVSPRLFDRRTPLNESMRLRKEIRALVDRSNAGDWFSGFHVQAKKALAGDNSVIVVPVLTERGGRIVIGIGCNGAADLHVVDGPAMDAAQAIFDSPGPPHGRGWQQQYIEHSAKGMPDDADLQEIGEALGRSFAAPLVQALDGLGIEPGAHLDILPQGPLGFLPVGLAVDGSGTPLMERYELSLSPSLAALQHARRRAADRPVSLVAVANPDGMSERSLPFAEMESAFLRTWFAGGQYLEGEALAPATVLDVLPGHAIWHFATHGRFEPSKPLQSRLSLGDSSALTLETLFETSGLGTPRLVVLSACETGLYDLAGLPGEFVGLPSGFIQAGAAGVIGTLWPVNDASTALLMGCFYEQYIGKGRTPSAALRAAQLWLRTARREDLIAAVMRWSMARSVPTISEIIDDIRLSRNATPYASPVYWSGFVHYGV